MTDPQIQYAKTEDGVNIAFAEFGDGVPLVYAPSLAGMGVHWYSALPYSRINVDSLADRGFRVIRYDGRGTGSSDRDNLGFTLDAALRDLEAVIKRTGLDRFVLLGHFQGAQVAIAYAVRHPERVSHLVLRDPQVSAADATEMFPGRTIIKAMRPLAEEQWELVSLNVAALGFGFTDLDAAKTYAEALRSGMTAEAWAAQSDAFEAVDVSGLLEAVGVPTLVIVDTASPSSASISATQGVGPTKRVAATIPDARLIATGDYAAAVDEFVHSGEPTAASARESTPAAALQTILFTDLVGHSEMMSRLGDERGRDVLREHERITRDFLKEHSGTEIKTMGDGFMASFGSVTKAVACAVALQKAFADHKGEPLSVRVGLNAGEPIEEDGDLFGTTVILASRIAAKAEGGEILVADTVRGLCSGKGFLFADRGEFVAKGFEDPVRLFEVRWREER